MSLPFGQSDSAEEATHKLEFISPHKPIICSLDIIYIIWERDWKKEPPKQTAQDPIRPENVTTPTMAPEVPSSYACNLSVLDSARQE